MARKRYESKKSKESPMVECACGCGETFPLYDKEGRPRKYATGHVHRKYDDPTQFKREWNHRNRKSRYQYKVDYGRQRKQQLILLKGGKCQKCGVEYDGKNAPIFDLHHRNPEEKEILLGVNGLVRYSWETILAEAEKCDLLCANCHRMVTAGDEY